MTESRLIDRKRNAEWYRKRAREIYGTEDVDFDMKAEIADSGDHGAGGCFVQAWVWVPDPEGNIFPKSKAVGA